MSEKSRKPAKGSDEPNLELPSFSLGRGRKKKAAADKDQQAAPQEQSPGPEPAGDTPTLSPEAAATVATEPAAPPAGTESHDAPVPDPAAPAAPTAQREAPPAPRLAPPSAATPSPGSSTGRTPAASRPKRPPAPGSAAARREAAARRQALEEAQRAAAQREADLRAASERAAARREAAEQEAVQQESAQGSAQGSVPNAGEPEAAARRPLPTAPPAAPAPLPPPPIDVAPTPAPEAGVPAPQDQVAHTEVLPTVPDTGSTTDPAAEPPADEPGKFRQGIGSRVMSSRDDVSRKTRMRRESSSAVGGADNDAESAGDNLAIHPRQDTEAFGARLPRLPGYLAAVVTGILMGLLGVVLAWASAQGCEAVRGVGSCGGFGLFALIVILGIEVMLGAALLKAWNVVDPVSTSFLGVGLVAVIVMLFFLDSIESRWMVVVIPALTALTYLGSWWVTETLIEGDTEEARPVDD